MSRPKGLEKTGGRQKGTENLLTKELRNILKGLIAQQLETLPEVLNQLDNDKRVDAVIKLLPFVIPKVENVEMDKDEPNIFGF